MFLPFLLIIPFYFLYRQFCHRVSNDTSLKRKLLINALFLMTIAGFSFVFYGIGFLLKTSDFEFWSGYVTRTEYYEEWDEQVPCSHDKYCKDSDGKEYVCGTLHDYDVDYHPSYWQIYTNNKEVLATSSDYYRYLVSYLGTSEKFQDMHRNYHSIDGDAYYVEWSGKPEHLVTTTTQHSYTNKVQNSNSLYNFATVTKEEKKDFQLFEYPKILDNYSQPIVLGAKDAKQARELDDCLDNLNAYYGQKHQIKFFVLLWDSQKYDVESALMQEQYWKKGNKNELIICLGTKGATLEQKPDWVYLISWTEQDAFMIDLEKSIQKTDDLHEICTVLEETVPKGWKRKEFADFDYIQVQSPWYMILINWITNLFWGAILFFYGSIAVERVGDWGRMQGFW